MTTIMTLRQFSTHYLKKHQDKPTETGTLNQLTKNKKKNIKLGTLTFKNTLSENKVYYLKMAVRLNDSTRIYFYTKVQSGSGYHLDDYLAFVLNSIIIYLIRQQWMRMPAILKHLQIR